MKFFRACLAAGMVGGMLVLGGCTSKEEPPAPGGAGQGTPANPTLPSKKAGFVCEKCGHTSDVAGDHCNTPMKKIGA
jgi:hypothetical protein